MENRPKRYKCPVNTCDKKYSRPCLLRQHVRSHTNEKPYKCPELNCEKAFLRLSHLKVHLISHSNVKPFNCNVCNKGFVTKQQLQRHELKHSPALSLLCQYQGCSQEFDSATRMNEHILDQHVIHDILASPPPQSLNDASRYGTNHVNKNSLVASELWVSLRCQEPICHGYPPFRTSFQLLEHYDEYHIFIPESLIEYAFNTRQALVDPLS